MSEEQEVVVTAPVATAPAIPVAQPVAPSSAIASLAAKRQAIKDKLHKDLKVPRYGPEFNTPELWVRYGPVDVTLTESAVKARRDSKIKDWSLYANADILAHACIGVYAVLDGNTDNKYSLRGGDENGEWTKFDADLAQALGLIAFTGAADVVKALYLTDGDLISAANQVSEWSGIKNAEVDSDF